MKKKTTITTEKHEVWIIHNPPAQITDLESVIHEPEPSSANTPAPMLDGVDADPSSETQQELQGDSRYVWPD